MFGFLTKTKKGFTLVELMIVLILLSLGAFAMINLFSEANRAYNKSEERYEKQEAVKQVALMLQNGSKSVASAQSADIFATTQVVPTGDAVDRSYSYLYAVESKDEEGNVNGYFICIQNRGNTRASAKQLSNIPIYIQIDPYLEYSNVSGAKKDRYNAVVITLAALEDSYKYPTDAKGNVIPPTSDDIFYSLDVAYHFPNMATDINSVMVNFVGDQRSTANLYDSNGKQLKGTHAVSTDGPKEGKGTKYNTPGIVLRVYCDTIITPDPTENDVSVQSLCFIATASYGKGTGEVGMLCDFRDKCLLTNPLGKAFVNAYYTISPPIADFIRESEPLKAAVRVALKPLIVVAEYCVTPEIRAEGIISLVMVFGCGIGATLTMMKIDKRLKREKRKDK